MPVIGLLFVWMTVSAADPEVALYGGQSAAEWRALMSGIDLRASESRRYVPGLTELMNDPAVPWITRRQAALTLGRLGPLARDAIPHVLRHVEEVDASDPETSPQRWALSSLALFGREAAPATPKLVQLLADESSSIVAKLGCLEALSQIGSAAPAAIPALWGELERRLSALEESAEDELAVGAAEALGMVGPDAAAAVPVLMRAAQSPWEDLRREAVRALGRIGHAARDAQSLLCDAMVMDESPLVRDVAMTALSQTGPEAWPLVEPLLSAVEVEVRERAVTVLAGWSSAAVRIVPALEPLLNDQEPRIRLAAARSWRALTGRHDVVWPLLVDLLNIADRPVRREVSKLLQEIARSQPLAETDLRILLTSPHEVVRKEGIRLQRLQRQRLPNSE